MVLLHLMGAAVASCSFWAAMHAAAVPILQRMMSPHMSQRLALLEPRHRVKLGHLLRSQLYNVFAVGSGATLLWRCSSIADLFHLYTPLHEVAFVVALGHWLVSLVEDYASTPESFRTRFVHPVTLRVAGGVSAQRLPGVMGRVLFRISLAHHTVASVAYAFLLLRRTLGGMGAIGLIYEAPVLLINVRELLVDFDEEVRWLEPAGGRATLSAVAVASLALFAPFRAGCDCLYYYVLCRHRDAIGALPAHARAVFLGCSAFFCLLNCVGGPWLLWTVLEDTQSCPTLREVLRP